MKPIRVTAPTDEPVSLSEVKEQARIWHSDDDATLQAYLSSAVALLDGYGGLLGRAIMEQEWMQPFRGWYGVMPLPMPGASEVAVKYTDQDGAEQTVSPALYEVVEGHTGSMVRFLNDFSAPSLKTDIAQPVRVTFTVGEADAANVDVRIKIAVGMMVDQWDRHGGEMGIPPAVHSLLAPMRWRVTG